MIKKIVSGGQTGVDRAALDLAKDLGIEYGGWCPKGRRSEDGIIPDEYPLKETPGRDYEQRTEWNVRDSEGTLILTTGRPEVGTAQSLETDQRLETPFNVVDLLAKRNLASLQYWIDYEKITVLNVAGPRESSCVPGIKAGMATEFLKDLIFMWKHLGCLDGAAFRFPSLPARINLAAAATCTALLFCLF